MPRSRRTLLAGLAGGFGVVGSIGIHLADRPTNPPSDVESFQYDTANTGTTDATTGPGPEATERWRADVWRAEGTSPVLVDDTVICAGYRCVGAFDRFDGTERWRTSLNEHVLEVGGSPAVEDGRVFVPTWNSPNEMNGIHALDVETGEQLWHARSGEGITGSPTVVDGIVYSGSAAGVTGRENGRLVALVAETGDERWDVVVDDTVTTPALADGVVYAGIDERAYVALEAETGDELWRYEADTDAGTRIRTAPTVVDDTVYVGLQDYQDDDATLRALDADDGTERWQRSVGTDVRGSVAVDDTRVYVWSTHEDGAQLVAVDRHDTTIRWASPRCGTSPVVVEDVAYIGRRSDGLEGGDIVALEATTGTERWAFTVDIRDAGDIAYVNVRNTPVVADGVVYAQTHAGDLYALETA